MFVSAICFLESIAKKKNVHGNDASLEKWNVCCYSLVAAVVLG